MKTKVGWQCGSHAVRDHHDPWVSFFGSYNSCLRIRSAAGNDQPEIVVLLEAKISKTKVAGMLYAITKIPG